MRTYIAINDFLSSDKAGTHKISGVSVTKTACNVYVSLYTKEGTKVNTLLNSEQEEVLRHLMDYAKLVKTRELVTGEPCLNMFFCSSYYAAFHSICSIIPNFDDVFVHMVDTGLADE